MRAISVLATVLILAGCDSGQVDTYPVSGRVQFEDGQPVRTGTIELESIQHGTTATGKIQTDGTFVLGTYTPDDGAAEGEHRVIVVQIIIADGITKHTLDHGRSVPPDFGDYSTSKLRAEVQAQESNEIVVTLSSKRPQ